MTSARTLGSALITRDTVDFDTPERRATSSSVGRCPLGRRVNTISDRASCLGVRRSVCLDDLYLLLRHLALQDPEGAELERAGLVGVGGGDEDVVRAGLV